MPPGGMAARVFAFGRCRRCTRLSGLAAAAAVGVAAIAVLSTGLSAFAATALVIAAGFTALWLAHRVAARRQGTLYKMLRAFGASPRDARAIAAILLPSLGLGGSVGERLPQGVTVNVTHGTAPGRAGRTITRVVVMRGAETVAGVVAAEPSGFRAMGHDDLS